MRACAGEKAPDRDIISQPEAMGEGNSISQFPLYGLT